jgi:hypothetical protein
VLQPQKLLYTQIVWWATALWGAAQILTSDIFSLLVYGNTAIQRTAIVGPQTRH